MWLSDIMLPAHIPVKSVPGILIRTINGNWNGSDFMPPTIRPVGITSATINDFEQRATTIRVKANILNH